MMGLCSRLDVFTLWKIIGRGVLALALAWPAAAQDLGGRFSGPTTTFRTYSLDGTTRTLIDPDEALNRQYTGQTAESLLALVTEVPAEGYARMWSRAVDAEVAIPLGWHAIEDNERVAIFNPRRTVRVILWRVDLEFEGAADIDKFLIAKAAALRTRFPTIKASMETISTGERIGLFENVPPRRGDREFRVVADLLIPNPRNDKRAFLVTLGAPQSEAEMYLPLLILIKKELKITWKKDR
jgi:hypothetical protein